MEEPREKISRQALHCCALSFTHPVTKEKMRFFEELPEDIARLLAYTKKRLEVIPSVFVC